MFAFDTGTIVVVLLEFLLALAVFVVAAALHLVDQLIHLKLRKTIFQHLWRSAIPMPVFFIEGKDLKIFPFLLGAVECQFLLLGYQFPGALKVDSFPFLRQVPPLSIDPG